MNIAILFVQALATVAITIYAKSNYKLSRTIQKENAEILHLLIVSGIHHPREHEPKNNLNRFIELLRLYKEHFKEIS